MERYAHVAGAQRHVTGWRPDLGDHRDRACVAMHERTLGTAPAVLRRRVDLRPSWWAPVRDQGQVGDCVEEGISQVVQLLGGPGTPAPSVRYPYYYARQAEGTPPSEDSGSQIRTGIAIWNTRGAPTESEWGREHAIDEQPPASLDASAARRRLDFFYPCPDLDTIKASLVQGYPCVHGFHCPENFFSPECARTGMLRYPEAGEGFGGSHCVASGGFDDDLKIGNEVGAVLELTSWSLGWGLAGWFWMPYRFFTDGLASSAWSPRRMVAPPAPALISAHDARVLF